MMLPISLAAAGNISGHNSPIAEKWARLNIMTRRIEDFSRMISKGGEGGEGLAIVRLSHFGQLAVYPGCTLAV